MLFEEVGQGLWLEDRYGYNVRVFGIHCCSLGNIDLKSIANIESLLTDFGDSSICCHGYILQLFGAANRTQVFACALSQTLVVFATSWERRPFSHVRISSSQDQGCSNLSISPFSLALSHFSERKALIPHTHGAMRASGYKCSVQEVNANDIVALLIDLFCTMQQLKIMTRSMNTEAQHTSWIIILALSAEDSFDEDPCI